MMETDAEPRGDKSERVTESVVERIDALIDMIISAYHTTRMIDTPAALHIRNKLGNRLTAALEALTTRSQPGEDAVESLDSQVERLAQFIIAEVPGEPSENEGAIDCAIRFIRAALNADALPVEGVQATDAECQKLRSALVDCELCAKPLLHGQFVNQYDDIGTAHANCKSPFAKPAKATPSPNDDGTTMPTFVLLGEPALLAQVA